MGDSLYMSGSNKNLEMPSTISSRKTSKQCLVVSVQKNLQKALKPLVSMKHGRLGGVSADQMVFFLIKVAALDLVRRLSRARCPFIWNCLQASQILCYPPFKWIQRWAPLKILVEGVQKLSRPLLFLTVATAISDNSDYSGETPDNTDESQAQATQPELPQPQSSPEVRPSAEALGPVISESWLVRLKEELEMQGITLPQRINDDELHRFYNAANGDFSCLLSSIKRTIRWRETYKILSLQELEVWSHMVFWHGCDIKLRPCLIVRLGLACSTLAYHDRPRFAQAVVSQIEHGVLHLLNVDDPRITVLMDCEGVSAFKFPMQMMRSCSILVQDHFPDRLGLMFVVRLPPVVRVIAHTLIQVLRPSTRKKLRVLGETYRKVLLEHLQSVPSFLGGHCSCTQCLVLAVGRTQSLTDEADKREPNLNFTGGLGDSYLTELPLRGSLDQILRTAIVGVLMLWIFIAFIASMYGPDGHSLWSS